MIKKHETGVLELSREGSINFENGVLHENFYHDELFMEDLSISAIEGSYYLIDTNKLIVYHLDYVDIYLNPLVNLLNVLSALNEGEVLRFEPEEDSDSLFKLWASLTEE